MYWNFDTQDWTKPDAYEMAQKVITNVEGGDIVLMHDIHANTISSLKTMIPGLREAGFQMVTLSELAAARGFDMEAGVTYFGFSDADIAHGAVSDKKDGSEASADAAAADTGNSDSGNTAPEQQAYDEPAENAADESGSTEETDSSGEDSYDESYDEADSEESYDDSGTESDYEEGDTAQVYYNDSAVAYY